MKKSQKKSPPNVAPDDIALRSSGVESQPPNDGSPADEQIRMRAYELYRERGEQAGGEMTDWLQAEREYYGYRKDD